MMNIMEIHGQKADISYDDEIQLFRGEFIGLNGRALQANWLSINEKYHNKKA